MVGKTFTFFLLKSLPQVNNSVTVKFQSLFRRPTSGWTMDARGTRGVESERYGVNGVDLLPPLLLFWIKYVNDFHSIICTPYECSHRLLTITNKNSFRHFWHVIRHFFSKILKTGLYKSCKKGFPTRVIRHFNLLFS